MAFSPQGCGLEAGSQAPPPKELPWVGTQDGPERVAPGRVVGGGHPSDGLSGTRGQAPARDTDWADKSRRRLVAPSWPAAVDSVWPALSGGFLPQPAEPSDGPEKLRVRAHRTAVFHAHSFLGPGGPRPHLCGRPSWCDWRFKGQRSSLGFCPCRSPTANTALWAYTRHGVRVPEATLAGTQR